MFKIKDDLNFFTHSKKEGCIREIQIRNICGDFNYKHIVLIDEKDNRHGIRMECDFVYWNAIKRRLCIKYKSSLSIIFADHGIYSFSLYTYEDDVFSILDQEKFHENTLFKNRERIHFAGKYAIKVDSNTSKFYKIDDRTYKNRCHTVIFSVPIRLKRIQFGVDVEVKRNGGSFVISYSDGSSEIVIIKDMEDRHFQLVQEQKRRSEIFWQEQRLLVMFDHVIEYDDIISRC